MHTQNGSTYEFENPFRPYDLAPTGEVLAAPISGCECRHDWRGVPGHGLEEPRHESTGDGPGPTSFRTMAELPDVRSIVSRVVQERGVQGGSRNRSLGTSDVQFRRGKTDSVSLIGPAGVSGDGCVLVGSEMDELAEFYWIN